MIPIMGILCSEGMWVKFRYFDPAGRQIAPEQLRFMQIMTPAMDHVFATVRERLEKNERSGQPIEKAALR